MVLNTWEVMHGIPAAMAMEVNTFSSYYGIPTYRPLLDIYAVHSYTDGIAYDLGSAPGWTALDTAVRKWNKELWMTETEFGGTYSWDLFFDLVKAQYAALKYGKVNAWLYWALNGGNGMFVSGGPTPRLYACMHFFRFIRPGYQQIECIENDPDIAAIAFKNGNDYSVVVLNMNSKSTKTVSFNNFTGKPGYFDMYRSQMRNATEFEKCAFAGRITGNVFELPPKSVVTLYYKASEPDVYWGVNPPTNLTASDITDNSFRIQWTAVQPWMLNGTSVGIAGYVIYLNGVKKTTSGPVTGTSYLFTGLQKNTTYTVEVYTRDALFNESVAARIQVTTTCSSNDCGPVISLDENKKQSLVIFPNPAREYFSVAFDEGVMYDLMMTDMTGKEVLHCHARQEEKINISHLPRGMYIVRINSGHEVMTGKVMLE